MNIVNIERAVRELSNAIQPMSEQNFVMAMTNYALGDIARTCVMPMTTVHMQTIMTMMTKLATAIRVRIAVT